MKMSRVAFAVAGGLLAVTLAGCGTGGASGNTVKFGAMIPMSGVSAAVGESMQDAIQLAVHDLNAKTKSIHLKPVYVDNPGDTATAIQNTKKLATLEHVPFAFTTFPEATQAVAPLATKYKMVLVNSASSDPSARGLSPYLFSTIPLDDQQVPAALAYAAHAGAKTLGVVYTDSAFGEAVKKIIPKEWADLGGKVVAEATVASDDQDFDQVVKKLQSANPDAVYAVPYGTPMGSLLVQAKALGFHTMWLHNHSLSNSAVQKMAAGAMKGAVMTYSTLADTPVAKKFARDFQKKYGSEPDAQARLAYSSVQVFYQAVAKLKADDKKVTGESLQKAMAAGTFQTVNGTIKFSKDGTASLPVSVARSDGKAFNLVGRVSADGTFEPVG